MRLAALALAAAVAATGATAQTAPPTSSVNQAVSNTLSEAIKQQYSQMTVPEVNGAISAIKAANANLFNSTCGAGKTWLCMAIYLDVPKPLPIGKSPRGGSFGGGGATGSWEAQDPCEDFDFRIDPSGKLVVPTIKLQGGGPLRYNRGSTDPGTPSYWAQPQPGTVYADNRDAAALWWYHDTNKTRPKAGWIGAYKKETNQSTGAVSYRGGSVAYYNGPTLVDATTSLVTPSGPSLGGLSASNAGSRDCPESSSTGGNFDFYWTAGYTCTWYAPNYGLSRSGYMYADEASLPLSESLNWPKLAPDHLRACKLDPALIKALAEKLWQKAGGYPGVPAPKSVCNDCVKTGGEDPHVEDLDGPPDLPEPTDNNPPPSPDPTPTPTPTATPTESVGEPPSVADPVAPEIDWWPDLPTISLSFGNPECPTYDMSVPQFGWVATLDSHCPLIDANRAAIGVIMMLMFSVGSILIVLRA